MPALGFLETATSPSVWEADRLFIQMPSVLAGVSWACCHASEGPASPRPLLSLLLLLLSSRDVCMTDVTSAGHHGDIKLSAGRQDAHNQCHPKGDDRFFTESSVFAVLFQSHVIRATVQMAKPREICS